MSFINLILRESDNEKCFVEKQYCRVHRLSPIFLVDVDSEYRLSYLSTEIVESAKEKQRNSFKARPIFEPSQILSASGSQDLHNDNDLTLQKKLFNCFSVGRATSCASSSTQEQKSISKQQTTLSQKYEIVH